MLGDGKPRRHEHCRPDHAVEANDVLADKVEVCRPELVVLAQVVGAVAERRDVVDEGIHPHVGDVLGVERQRDAPVEGRAAHRQVVHAAFDERADLVFANLRANELGVLVIVGKELVSELGELEKPVLFLDEVDVTAAGGALAVFGQVAFCPLRFARGAVVALVGALVEVALVIEVLHELLDAARVALLRRADEVVVGDVELFPEVRELRDLAVAPLLGRHAVLLRRLGDLLAVLVHARQEPDVVVVHALPARDGVGGNGRVRRADVGHAVHIVDGSRHVERFFGHADSFDQTNDVLRALHAGFDYRTYRVKSNRRRFILSCIYSFYGRVLHARPFKAHPAHARAGHREARRDQRICPAHRAHRPAQRLRARHGG